MIEETAEITHEVNVVIDEVDQVFDEVAENLTLGSAHPAIEVSDKGMVEEIKWKL